MRFNKKLQPQTPLSSLLLTQGVFSLLLIAVGLMSSHRVSQLMAIISLSTMLLLRGKLLLHLSSRFQQLRQSSLPFVHVLHK